MKIKNIQLGYNVPLSADSSLTGLRIYASAKNAFTFTDYTGYDPEISNGGNAVLDSGVDRGPYPSQEASLPSAPAWYRRGGCEYR